MPMRIETGRNVIQDRAWETPWFIQTEKVEPYLLSLQPRKRVDMAPFLKIMFYRYTYANMIM